MQSGKGRDEYSNPLLPKADDNGFGPFGHPISASLGISIFGIWRLLKNSGLPPFRTSIKVRSRAENVFTFGFPVALIMSAVVPWIVLQSLVAVIFVYVGFTLLALAVMMPPAIRDSMRNLPPRGTYWDGSKFIRDRSFPLGRKVPHFEQAIPSGETES